jgi:hypothetical protein
MANSSLLNNTLSAIDLANSRDPNTEWVNGQEQPKELIYGQRMSDRLHQFEPEASDHLRIAARAQHIERWVRPRADYPEGRTGYKKWRAELGLYHAQRAGEIMAEQGYEQDDVDRVKFLIQKRQLRRDPETQTLEDVICLVFLEHYLADFATKHPEDKLIDIIQKTWNKMSPKGHEAALKLPLTEDLRALVAKALS